MRRSLIIRQVKGVAGALSFIGLGLSIRCVPDLDNGAIIESAGMLHGYKQLWPPGPEQAVP